MSSGKPEVLDTNVILRPEALDGSSGFVATRGVKREVKSKGAALKLEALQVKFRQPDPEIVEYVREESTKINASVSETDIELAALTEDLNGVLRTDDLDLQNLCEHLGIDYEGVYEKDLERRKWKKVCPACGGEWQNGRCQSCGFSGDATRERVDN